MFRCGFSPIDDVAPVANRRRLNATVGPTIGLHTTTTAGAIRNPSLKIPLISDVIRVGLLSITLGYLFAYKVLSVNPVAPGRDRAFPPSPRDTTLYTCARRATFCICLWLMFSYILYTRARKRWLHVFPVFTPLQTLSHWEKLDISFQVAGYPRDGFTFLVSDSCSGLAADLCRCLIELYIICLITCITSEYQESVCLIEKKNLWSISFLVLLSLALSIALVIFGSTTNEN